MVPFDGSRSALRALEHALAELHGRADATARAAGIGCVRHVRIGHPGEEIAACAAEQGCDAIIMGTRGMSAAAGLLLGSVATKVVHLAPVPVTLVR